MNKTILLIASWCGPCHLLKNKMISEKLSADEVYDIDDEAAIEIYKKYQVRTVPSLLVLDENDNLINIYKGIEDTVDYLKTSQ